MTPAEAVLIIEKLIEKHGPDCGETGHKIIIRGGEPMILDNNMKHDPCTDTLVCEVSKSGMKNGFSTRSWNEMGEKLAFKVKLCLDR